jgi:hypothetical protein
MPKRKVNDEEQVVTPQEERRYAKQYEADMRKFNVAIGAAVYHLRNAKAICAEYERDDEDEAIVQAIKLVKDMPGRLG